VAERQWEFESPLSHLCPGGNAILDRVKLVTRACHVGGRVLLTNRLRPTVTDHPAAGLCHRAGWAQQSSSATPPEDESCHLGRQGLLDPPRVSSSRTASDLGPRTLRSGL
jgi:hypothetical protein